MIGKIPLPCAACGVQVKFSLMQPYYEKVKSGLIVSSNRLLGYDYTCPQCGGTSFYNKDAVRDSWQSFNPGITIARKL